MVGRVDAGQIEQCAEAVAEEPQQPASESAIAGAANDPVRDDAADQAAERPSSSGPPL